MRIGEIYDCGRIWFRITKIDKAGYWMTWNDGTRGLVSYTDFINYLKQGTWKARIGFKEYLEQIEQL